MNKSRFTENQIVKMPKDYDSRIEVQTLCSEHGIVRTTLYSWLMKYSGMDVLLCVVL